MRSEEEIFICDAIRPRMILSIQGPQAIGKSTALRWVQNHLQSVHCVYENPYPIVRERDNLKYDITTESGFVSNQKLFIDAEIKRYRSLPDSLVIFDRGPEDTECYSVNYPKVIGKDWDTEELLRQELNHLRHLCSIDAILYLTTSEEVLQTRMLNDTSRRRSSFNIRAFRIYEEWYREKENVEFIDISEMGPLHLGHVVLQWVLRKTSLL